MSCTTAMPSRAMAVISALLLSSIVCLAGKHFVMPEAQPAKTYPAHDEHPTEGVTLALDPYDMADKAAIFSVRYSDYGLMPILVVITNDGDQPVVLSEVKAQLVTVNRTKIPPATDDDLYRRLARAPSSSVSPNPL